MSTPSPKHPLALLQVLRAFAAGIVVIHHASSVGKRCCGFNEWADGAAGVDIFFIISGFVMAYSSRSLVSRAKPGWTFLKRRVERIYPLYWVLTTLKIVIGIAAPALIGVAMGGPLRIVGSYLLLPLAPGADGLKPVLVWGWTLMFEMFFYLLFSLALGLRQKPLLIVTPILGILTALAFWQEPIQRPFSGYIDPIVLEFIYGMLLFEAFAWWRRRTRKHSLALGLGLGIVGLFVLLISRNEEFTLGRPFIWGVPALMVVAGALLLEEKLGQKVPKLLLILGDQSYSLYLTHVFLLALVSSLYRRLHGGVLAGAYPLVAVFSAYFVAHVCYTTIEHPCIVFFRGRRTAAVASGT